MSNSTLQTLEARHDLLDAQIEIAFKDFVETDPVKVQEMTRLMNEMGDVLREIELAKSNMTIDKQMAA